MKNRAKLEFDAAIVEALPDGDMDAAIELLGKDITLATTDAVETMVFARQLESVKNRVYEKKYPPLKCRTFVDDSNSADPTSDTLTYRVWDAFVVAKVMDIYATDIPMVAASGREMQVRYFTAKDGYQYHIDEMRKAQRLGIELQTKYADAARRGIELARDAITAYGVPDNGSYGLVNHPNATLRSLPNGNWANASGLEILEDLNFLVTEMLVDTLETFSPNKIILSTVLYRVVTTKLLSADANNSSNISVLDMFEKQNPGISVESWQKLSGSAPDGAHDRIICYKKDSEILEFETGVEFEVLPVEYSRGWFTHVCQAKYAGVQIYYPLAVCYADNA